MEKNEPISLNPVTSSVSPEVTTGSSNKKNEKIGNTKTRTVKHNKSKTQKTKIPEPNNQNTKSQRKANKDRGITLPTKQKSIPVPYHLKASIESLETSYNHFIGKLVSDQYDTIYAIHTLTQEINDELNQKEKKHPGLKPLINEYRVKSNRAIREKRAMLCGYKVLVESKTITANKAKDCSSFTYDPNDKNSVVKALKLLVPRIEDTVEKKPKEFQLVKAGSHGDISFIKERFGNQHCSKKQLAKLGLFLDQKNNLKTMQLTQKGIKSLPVTQQSAFKATKHLLDNNQPRKGKKYPFKVEDYELAFKTFDYIYQKKNNQEGQNSSLKNTPPPPVQISKEDIEAGVKAVIISDQASSETINSDTSLEFKDNKPNHVSPSEDFKLETENDNLIKDRMIEENHGTRNAETIELPHRKEQEPSKTTTSHSSELNLSTKEDHHSRSMKDVSIISSEDSTKTEETVETVETEKVVLESTELSPFITAETDNTITGLQKRKENSIHLLLKKHSAENKAATDLRAHYEEMLKNDDDSLFIFKLYATALETRVGQLSTLPELIESSITGENGNIFSQLKNLRHDTKDKKSTKELINHWKQGSLSTAAIDNAKIDDHTKNKIFINCLPLAFEEVKNIRKKDIDQKIHEIKNDQYMNYLTIRNIKGYQKYDMKFKEEFKQKLADEQKKDNPDFSSLAESLLYKDHVKYARDLGIHVNHTYVNFTRNTGDDINLIADPAKNGKVINPQTSFTTEGITKRKHALDKRRKFDSDTILLATSHATVDSLRMQT